MKYFIAAILCIMSVLNGSQMSMQKENALLRAILNDNIDAVKKLFEGLPHPDINAITFIYNGESEWTPITFVAYKDYAKILKFFIQTFDKTDLDKQNNSGDTALKWATINGNKDMVKLLIAAGVDVNKQDKYNRTALMSAVNKSYTTIIKLLIDAEADLNIQDDGGNTALMRAARLDNSSMVKLLFSLGTDIDLNKQNEYGCTALMQAVNDKNPSMVKLLVSLGADDTVQNKKYFDKTAIDYAFDENKPGIQKAIAEGKQEWAKYLKGRKEEIEKHVPVTDLANIITGYLGDLPHSLSATKVQDTKSCAIQ